MVETHDLLVEIGTEELPPAALLRLSQTFAEGLQAQLSLHHLGFGAVASYATPRRGVDLRSKRPSTLRDNRPRRPSASPTPAGSS